MANEPYIYIDTTTHGFRIEAGEVGGVDALRDLFRVLHAWHGRDAPREFMIDGAPTSIHSRHVIFIKFVEVNNGN